MSSMDRPHTIKKTVRTRLRGKTEYGKVIDEIWLEHSPRNYPKEYCKGVQKVRFDSDGEVDYRFCYYVRDKGGKSWYWGRNAPFFPVNLTDRLIAVMKKKRWIR
jgi:hypothetical protein